MTANLRVDDCIVDDLNSFSEILDRLRDKPEEPRVSDYDSRVRRRDLDKLGQIVSVLSQSSVFPLSEDDRNWLRSTLSKLE